MLHWTMYRAMTFFSQISFSAILCIALVTFFPIHRCYNFHILISHYSVRCPAQYTSLFRDGIFDDSTSVYIVLPFFSQWLTRYSTVYANSILAMYGFSPFPLTFMPIYSFPRFNARKQLREKLEEPLELPTNMLFDQPESQNMLLMRSNPFSTSESGETKYSEYAFSSRGAYYLI